MHLRTLKLGRDKVLKDQFNEGKIGRGMGIGEALKTGHPFKLNDFDRFEIFIKNALKDLKKKNHEKIIKSD